MVCDNGTGVSQMALSFLSSVLFVHVIDIFLLSYWGKSGFFFLKNIVQSCTMCVKRYFTYSIFLKDILSEGRESVHVLQQPDSTSVWACHSASTMHTQPYMVMML